MKLLQFVAIVAIVLGPLGGCSARAAPNSGLRARSPQPGNLLSRPTYETHALAGQDPLAGLPERERTRRLELAWSHVHPPRPGPRHAGASPTVVPPHAVAGLEREVALIRRLHLRFSDMAALGRAEGARARARAAGRAHCAHRGEFALACAWAAVGGAVGSTAAATGLVAGDPLRVVAGVGLSGTSTAAVVSRLQHPEREHDSFLNWHLED